ncbi:MAG: hypothetical protein ACD_84C00012G0002 [uncultured bacterium]|nr:MAG: hypothetical protein ACD_84C00012G0002 [uncultured bacterium]
MNDICSLNAGNELPGEPVVEPSNELLTTTPNISVDIKALTVAETALENAINDLAYLADSIKTASGMNQQFAMEAEKIVPGFGGVPIGFYTKDTTATRYKVTLEEISGQMWAMIIAASIALVALLAKLISWLFSDSKKDEDGGSSKRVTQDTIKKQEGYSEKIKSVIPTVSTGHNELINMVLSEINKTDSESNKKATDFAHQENTSIDGILAYYIARDGAESQLAKTIEERDPIFHDFMHRGEYFKLMHSFENKIPEVRKMVEELITNLNKLTHAVHVDYERVNLNSDKVELVNVNPIVVDMTDDIKRIHITDFVSHVENTYDHVKQSTPHNPRISLYELNSLFSSTLSAFNPAKIIGEIDSFEGILEKAKESLDANVNELMKIKERGNYVQMNLLVAALKEANHAASLDIKAVSMFLKHMRDYVYMTVDMFNRVKHVNDQVGIVVQRVLKENSFPITDELKELYETLVVPLEDK